jgi:mono/diheme cytochrome c family protein
MKQLFVAALGALASCTAAPQRNVTSTGSTLTLAAEKGETRDTTPLSASLARGQQTVRTVCAACHTEAPPPKAAPPFRMIATHYRQATPDSAAAVAAIVAYVRAPAANRSLLPPMVIQRFGLMPAQPLGEEQLGDAARYILSLDGGGGMRGMGGMRGRRVTPGRGMPHGSVPGGPPPR